MSRVGVPKPTQRHSCVPKPPFPTSSTIKSDFNSLVRSDPRPYRSFHSGSAPKAPSTRLLAAYRDRPRSAPPQ